MLKDKKKVNEEEEFQKDFNTFFSSVFKDSMPLLRLYNVERKGVKYVKEYRHTYETIPTEAQIGHDFGGGRFWICGEDPETEEMCSRYINIHKSFTEKLNARLEKEQGPGPAPPAPPPPDPYAGIEKLLAVATPLIKLFMDNRPTAPVRNNMEPNFKPVMDGLVSSFTSGFKQMGRSMMENQKELLLSQGKEPPASAELSGVGMEIMGMIKTFGEAFINSKGFVKNKIKDEILKNEDIQNLSNEDLGAVYDACKADPEIGEDKISKIFTDLDFVVKTGDEPENNGKPEKEPEKQPA